MSDVDELHQLMSGRPDGRDGALRDVLNSLAGSPDTHRPRPTPALAQFLQQPTPPRARSAVQRRPAWSRRLVPPRSGNRRRLGAGVLAGWLAPLLVGTATAAVAVAIAIVTAHGPGATAPAGPVPAWPSVTRPLPTGAPTRLPKTTAGSSATRVTSHTTKPRSHHGDDGSGAEDDDDQ
jgi:hypothetical protein